MCVRGPRTKVGMCVSRTVKNKFSKIFIQKCTIEGAWKKNYIQIFLTFKPKVSWKVRINKTLGLKFQFFDGVREKRNCKERWGVGEEGEGGHVCVGKFGFFPDLHPPGGGGGAETLTVE